jgi:curved DNA-binding protein CbpA
METKSPWEILGVPETASDDAVKLAWRKLILKCHPDKAAEDQKEAKAEEFKKVNEAYKTITEPDLRRKYEDEKERKKRFAESGPSGAYGAATSTPSRSYNTRTAAPSSAYGATPRDPRDSRDARDARDAREPHAYEYSRSPEDSYEEMRSSSRKYPSGYDGHHSYSRRDIPKTPRSSHRESVKTAKESERASRSERRRREDRAKKDERKFVHVESDSDERGQYEDNYNRKNEEMRNRDRQTQESRRHEDSRRIDERKSTKSRSDSKYDERANKLYDQTDEAMSYMLRQQAAARPSYMVRRTTGGVPSESYVRRSSARRDSERPARERRRGSGPEIVEPPRMPEFKHSTSSPSNIKIRVPEHKAPPSFQRSSTMPTPRSSKKDASTKLRGEIIEDSGYSSPDDHPTPTSHKYSAYAYAADGSSRVLDEGYRTVLREPGSSRRKSPSPARRARYATPTTPSRGASYRMMHNGSSSEDMEEMSRSRPSLYSTVRHTQPGSVREPPSRQNSEPLFGEISKDPRGSRYDPSKISYAPKINASDITYSIRHGDYDRPRVSRTSTAAY